jgi:multidrug efflux pump subunit AcrB
MNGLIRFALHNPRAITVLMLTIVMLGVVCLSMIPADILPVYRSPAVQVLTFYNGMSATNIEKDITARMERWTGQAAGTARQESRSIIGASIIRNYYADDIDPSAALTQVNSLATAAIPNLPPGTLPPVILPYDPTSSTPVCLIALNSQTQDESTLYDTGRYQVRNMIMALPGSNAPVVYGGRLRTILAYLDRQKLQARNLTPVDVMNALDRYNVFLPAGDAKFGLFDYALDSNSMYDLVKKMGDIPIKIEGDKVVFLKDVATAEDTSLIQTNVVRVDGRRQVYIPVYRQQGASTLDVVGNLKSGLKDMKDRLTTPDVDLKLVMDQSIYVSKAIESLAEEGVLGAILCSLVILVFLGEWRMTLIAVITIPIAVLGAIACLYTTGNTINVMTLAGLALAIGPMVDSAIICLENTHRHMGLGANPRLAAFLGASEVAMPELVASLCTLLVLAPLAMMPGMGKFLFRPMFLAVTFAMCIAYILSRTFVPSRCAKWLKAHGHKPIESTTFDRQHRNVHENAPAQGLLSKLFEKWEGLIDIGISIYIRLLRIVMKARILTVIAAFGLLTAVVLIFGTRLRQEFFPEVDAGAFEIYVRAESGTRIEVTENGKDFRLIENFFKEHPNEKLPNNIQLGGIGLVENFVKEKTGDDLELVISELGLTADWSAAFTPNSGPMDAVLKVQLKGERSKSAQEYVDILRRAFAADPRFGNLEFAFDAGGMIRAAMNEGKSTPINVRIRGKELEKAREIAENILNEVKQIDGVVDARILQRLDYPEYFIEVDRAKAADLGLNQVDVMRNIISSFNSSVQFNKRNFWIDPVNHNQYFVGVQYKEGDITSLETLLNVPINSPIQKKTVLLGTLIKQPVQRLNVPSEVAHTNLQPTIDLTMGVYGRDLGHVAADVNKIVEKYGKPRSDGGWSAFDPDQPGQVILEGSKITMTGEYQKMQQTFRNQAFGMILAVILIYFLMVALFKSYVTPLVVLSAVPVGGVGVILMLYFTGTAINVQSLLGMIFMVGIVVSNTVLLTDFAQNLRKSDNLEPTEAITRAAGIRVRPVVMTALATFFALIPMSLSLSRGSEANVPLGRAVLGGLLAGMMTTLFVVPALYSLLVHGSVKSEDDEPIEPTEEPKQAGHDQPPGHV